MNKPRLGQHFLNDLKYVYKAIEAADLQPNDAVIEVGPGKGVLTKAILKKCGYLLALELDERLADHLHERLGHHPNLEIRKQDARYISWEQLSQELLNKGFASVKLIANLPYYMASQMIIHALAANSKIELLVIMVQDEVARRICALPNTKDYSSFSIAVQIYGAPRYIVKVPPKAFNPPPRVNSAIISIRKHQTLPIQIKDVDKFLFLVHAVFMHRRKTMRNCLQGLKNVPDLKHWEVALNTTGIDQQRRPETLTVEEFARLAEWLDEVIDPSAVKDREKTQKCNFTNDLSKTQKDL